MRSITCASSGWISTSPWSPRAPASAISNTFDSASSSSWPDVLAHRVERGVGDLGADLRQAALHRALAHDLGVAPDVVRGRRVLRQRAEIGGAAGLVLVLARLDRLGHRDHVGRLAVLDQLGDVAADAAMVVAVEIVARDEVGDAVPGLVVEQQPPSTDCSASIECGGTFSARSCGSPCAPGRGGLACASAIRANSTRDTAVKNNQGRRA